MQDPFSIALRVDLPFLSTRLAGPPQAQPESQTRQTDAREQTFVDEENRDDLAVEADQGRIEVDVDDLPFARTLREESVHFLPHLVAEMTAGARQQAQPNPLRRLQLFQRASGSELRATRRM